MIRGRQIGGEIGEREVGENDDGKGKRHRHHHTHQELAVALGENGVEDLLVEQGHGQHEGDANDNRQQAEDPPEPVRPGKGQHLPDKRQGTRLLPFTWSFRRRDVGHGLSTAMTPSARKKEGERRSCVRRKSLSPRRILVPEKAVADTVSLASWSCRACRSSCS